MLGNNLDQKELWKVFHEEGGRCFRRYLIDRIDHAGFYNLKFPRL